MLDDLAVPEVLQISDPGPVANADFLITALLRKGRAMLYAEHGDVPDEIVHWIVCDAAHNEERIAQSDSRGHFRAILARFGHHYMAGQLYGGHVRRILTQHGLRFVCEIFMSNQNWPGCWIRIYVRPE